MTLTELLDGLRRQHLDFEDTLAFIEAHYQHTPTAFRNGEQHNDARSNQGACRVLALGQRLGLSVADTLQLFGRHYRDVLATPDGQDHANIRQFMANGFDSLRFDGNALTPR